MIGATIAGGKALLAVLAKSKLAAAIKAGGTMAAKGAGTAAKTTAGSVSRFAGPKLAATGTRLASQFKGLTPKEAAILFGPDVASGVIAGAVTPGDALDKLTIGTGATVGGVVGGAAGRSLMKPGRPIGALGYVADMAGSSAGDMAGYRAAEGAVRARNGGLTPAELEALQYEEQVRQQAILDYLSGR